MLRLPGVDAGSHAPHFFHVESRTMRPVITRRHQLIAARVNRHPVEDFPVQLGTETAFSNLRLAVLRLVREDGIGIDAVVVTPQAVANFQVAQRAAGIPGSGLSPAFQRLVPGNSVNGDLHALALVRLRVNGHGGRQLRGLRGVLLPIPGGVAGCVTHHLFASEFQRQQVAGSLADTRR